MVMSRHNKFAFQMRVLIALGNGHQFNWSLAEVALLGQRYRYLL